MKFYGIVCAFVAVALLMTPAIAMQGKNQDEKNAATDVSTNQTTVAATQLQTETITTDGE